jgi:hypothetical protein
MRLEKNAVDLFEIDCASVVADSLDQGGKAKIASVSQDALGCTDDESEGLVGKSGVWQRDAIELAANEFTHVIGGELWNEDRIGHAAADILIRHERERSQQARLGNEDEVVILWKIIEEQAQVFFASRTWYAGMWRLRVWANVAPVTYSGTVSPR